MAQDVRERAAAEAEPGDAAVAPRHEELNRPFGGELLILTLCLVVAGVLATLGDLHWQADLLTHFRLHLLAGALIGALLAAVLRRRLLGLAALMAVIALYSPVAAYLAAAPPAEGAAAAGTLRVAAVNVDAPGGDPDAVAAWVEASGADVVVLAEVSPRFQKALKRLSARYPTQALSAGSGIGDVAVLSRGPMALLDVENVDGQPLVSVRLTREGRSLRLLAAHPRSPTDEASWSRRNAMLVRLAQRAAEGGPVLVAGDLNATPWTPFFRDLLRIGGVSGPLVRGGTYPSWLGPLGLPIDHILTGHGAVVSDVTAGYWLASDHRPLLATVRF